MSEHKVRCHCCPQVPESQTHEQQDVSRRSFLAMGGVMMGGLTWSALQSELHAQIRRRGRTANASPGEVEPIVTPNPRKPLIVKPILLHDLPQRQEKTSWRNWGGVDSPEAAEEEVGRIRSELASVKQKADYPIEFLDVTKVTNVDQLSPDHPDITGCDLILLYGAGYPINGIQNFGKDVIIFQRWRSGPVYYQYEGVSARFLRQHRDVQSVPNIKEEDVVTDELSELDWRFRALCGLKNTMNAKIVTIGGASAFANGDAEGGVVETVRRVWNFQYNDVGYDELDKLIHEAMADAKTVERAKKRAQEYLKIPGTKLETSMECFENNFVLDDVFRLLMKRVDTNLITVNSCMGPIMSKANTSACMTLSILNDDGFLAFCESDFVVIPSGVLLGNITGKPVFLNDPCYPHNSIITVAHCTAPRKMNGKTYDPVRIMTHFESDYGAAPKIEFPLGMLTTNIVPDYMSKRWVGVKGTICDVPFRPICRSQFDIKYECSDLLLARRMPGFHFMTCYGDYTKEIGYALRRVGIEWDNLDELPAKTMS